MKLFILAVKDGPVWACDNICSDWKSSFPETVSNLEDCDIIWLLSNWQWRLIPIKYLRDKKVICTIHHVVQDKLDQDNFKARDEYVDIYHVPCEITRNILSQHTKKEIEVLPYWYVKDDWCAQDDKRSLKDQYNLPKNKILIGSFQRDTEGSDLKSPKLEKGPDLFCDIIESLNNKPHIILTGWRRDYVINRLNKNNISHSYFEMVDHKTMNDLYNCLDYYLITSRVEGGPQSLLEASACGTRVLSTDVGMATQVLHENYICSGVDDFVNNLNSQDPQVIWPDLEKFDFNNIGKLYFDFFNQI